MKGLIFSFNNVLCDSNALYRRAFQNALKEHGYFWSNELERSFERSDSNSRLDYLIETRQIKKEDVDLVEYACNSFEVDMMSEAKFSERAFEILENMKNKGVKIGIAARANRQTVISFLKWTRLNELVDFVTTDDNVYEQTLKKMGLNPTDVVAFEGSYRGVAMARQAGVEHVREVSTRSLESTLEYMQRISK